MFKFVKPQVVANSNGVSVMVLDRFHVGYSDEKIDAKVEVDFGLKVSILSNTLKVVRQSKDLIDLTPAEKQKTISLISEGVSVLAERDVEIL